MTKVSKWVQEIVSDTGYVPLYIGLITYHPDGRKVKIIDGQYWGTYGLSNFWEWKEVLSDGSLSKTTECGYGWNIARPTG